VYYYTFLLYLRHSYRLFGVGRHPNSARHPLRTVFHHVFYIYSHTQAVFVSFWRAVVIHPFIYLNACTYNMYDHAHSDSYDSFDSRFSSRINYTDARWHCRLSTTRYYRTSRRDLNETIKNTFKRGKLSFIVLVVETSDEIFDPVTRVYGNLSLRIILERQNYYGRLLSLSIFIYSIAIAARVLPVSYEVN